MIFRTLALAALVSLGLDAAAQAELSDVAKISVGGYRSCALTNAGAVKCWGAGPLGDGSTAARSTAVQVQGLESGVVDISAGGARGTISTGDGQGHQCAVMNTGGVKCWGWNYAGQLGDGTTTTRNTPVDVVGLPGPATAVAAGTDHTCALLAGGAVRCWGESSRIGGTDLTSGIVAITGKGYHSCALTAAGGVKCWGSNHSGQLGDGTTTDRFFPVDVQGLGSGVVSIGAAGIWDPHPTRGGFDGSYTCALTTQGGVKCWGANVSGTSGDNTLTPVDVAGLTGGIAQLATGGSTLVSQSCCSLGVTFGIGLTCVVTSGGGAKCWGNGESNPSDVTGLTSGVIAVDTRGTGACGIVTGGKVKCWGWPSPSPQSVFLDAPAPQTISLTGAYGRLPIGSTTGLGAASSSGLPVVFATTTPGVCSVSGSTATGLAQGLCTITVNQPGNANWDPAPQVTFQIVVGDPLPQTITFGVAPTVPVNGVGNLDANASSGLAVGYASSTPSICTVSGNIVTGVALGSCTVAASQAGNDFYQPAPQVTQTFPVTANAGTQVLIVSRGGTGIGTVTSAPAGINCGTQCGGNFAPGSTVTLTPAAGMDSFFDRWTGACTGTGACVVTMGGIQDVTAHFQSSIPRLANMSTRARVLTGADVMIAGFIIEGSAPKTVVVRARGPSLAAQGIASTLQDPTIQLYSGSTRLAYNFDWQQLAVAAVGGGTACCSPGEVAALNASGFAPSHPREAAIVRTLQPGAYSAIVTEGVGNTGDGVAIVEIFEADAVTVPLINISTRGKVQTGDDVMIAGFIIQGQGPQTVVVRARGPSLAAAGVPGVLANPTMQVFSGATPIASNDDWMTSPDAGPILASGFAPLDDAESAVMLTLQPGAYSAIVSGVGGTTGVAIVEVFRVP